MNNKTLAIILIVLGLILVLVGLLGPAQGIVGWEWAVLIVGILLLIVGILLLFVKGTATEAEPTTLGAAVPVAAKTDDLTRIEGIGPRLQGILYELGYKTYASLANTNPDQLMAAVKAAGFKAPFDPASWPQQATLAAAGSWDDLKELQDRLSGGRM
ncbi:MAG: DUF4332 domain-containing protein [Anaerolineae bacterium]|nr:DUF4332 domain-containing protein [Anaerolineae bacterium]